MKMTILFLFALALLAFGMVSLFSPRTVQELARRSLGLASAQGSSWVSQFVQSNAYLWSVRAVGLVALGMAVALLVAGIRGA
jgi:hypothetical protein